MTRSRWDWQRVGDDLEAVLVASGTYPAFFLSRFVAALRYGWRLGQSRPEAAPVAPPTLEQEARPRVPEPEEPRSPFVPTPVDEGPGAS